MISIITGSVINLSSANVDYLSTFNFESEDRTIENLSTHSSELSDQDNSNQDFLKDHDIVEVNKYPVQLPFKSLLTDSTNFFDGQTLANHQQVIPNINLNAIHEDLGINSTIESQKSVIVRLITSSRQGKQYFIDFEQNSDGFIIVQDGESPENQTIPIDELENVVEILADEQEFLEQDGIINARGNVVIRFANGVLTAEQISVNLNSRIAVAQGNVSLERGEQILKGERFEYFFVQNEGVITNASGTIYQPSLRDDVQIRPETPNIVNESAFSLQIQANQPLQEVRSQPGINLILGSEDNLDTLQSRLGIPLTEESGSITQLRFEAETVEFDGKDWTAKNIRVTNDPFSPPQLEVRADSAKLVNVSPFRDELNTTNSRVVFDNKVSLPLFINQFIFTPRRSRPFTFSLGYDGDDLGGLYLERDFSIYDRNDILLTITPQFLVQRALFPDSLPDQNISNPDDNGGLLNPSSYGLMVRLDASLTERTDLVSTTNITGLDLSNFSNRLRANLRVFHRAGNLNNPYRVTGEISSRERLFNGTLGFQTVESSIGALITSPFIPLGNSNFRFIYQGAIQNITANTDREEFLSMDNSVNTINLTRYQAIGKVSGLIPIWRGQSLPPTPTQGLRYTPVPVTPFFGLTTGVSLIGNYYSNNDTQGSLTTTVGFQGQIGNFSKKTFDYTAFNLSYSRGVANRNSPFLFDRFADTQVLSFGINQQLYGGFKGGFQTFINVDTGKSISTDYILEYSRRAYGIVMRYNPVLEIGSINLRISNFNWQGDTEPFDSSN